MTLATQLGTLLLVSGLTLINYRISTNCMDNIYQRPLLLQIQTNNSVHLIHAGTFYLIWGLWWTFISFWTYLKEPQEMKNETHAWKSESFLAVRHSKDPLTWRSWIPQPFCPKIPLEPIIKVILPGLGIIVEMFFDIWPDASGNYRLVTFVYTVRYDESSEQYVNLDRLYHISLYLAFVISGVVDLLSLLLKLPSCTSQLFLCFALYCQTLLFYSHIPGRRLFNKEVHLLLLVLIIATAIFATLRMFNPQNLLINSGLAGGMILQGTNLIQAGSLLYGGRKWSQHSNNNPKFIAAATTWHLLGTGLFMILMFVVIRAILFKCHGRQWYIADANSAQHVAIPEKERLINDEDNTASIEMQDLDGTAA